MKKGLDKCFLNYGIRKEDMDLIEQACHDADIDPEWMKDSITLLVAHDLIDEKIIVYLPKNRDSI